MEEEEESDREDQPSSKMRRCDDGAGEDGPYNHIIDSALREELRRRLFKVRGRSRSEMILLLEEDDRNQMKIVLGNQCMGIWGQAGNLKGVNSGVKEEKREEDTKPLTGEDEEDNWVDVKPLEGEANGRGTEGAASPKQSLGRQSPVSKPGRPGGRKGRGYWVRRKGELLKGRIKSAEGGGQVKKDSKGTREQREGEDTRAGPGPGAGV